MPLPVIHTYKDGPTFKIGDSFTMRNVMNIIEKMNNAMPHHEFEPEPIKEGGIRIKSDGEPFKTIRLRVNNWPWLIPGAEIDLDRKLSCEKNTMYTFLKAFDGASPWTKDEIKCIDLIFEEEGLKKVRR
jgi:hypothetical protein